MSIFHRHPQKPALELAASFAILDSKDPRDIALNALPATASVKVPESWSVHANTITPPRNMSQGTYEITFDIDQQTALAVTDINTPRGLRYHAEPAKMRVLAVDLEKPRGRIAYIGGGRDRVFSFLNAAGFAITDLSPTDDLAQHIHKFDTLLIGVFAFRFAPCLTDAHDILKTWVNAGGNLVTLYHRPTDNWYPDKLPAYLEIGTPSLRFRVTDENAHVDILSPAHPILNTPNKIDHGDWRGWDKERGLYFAKQWDGRFEKLVAIADPDEEAHEGALLSARIGRGKHTHIALNLHHQIESLTLGAYRLMANILDNNTSEND